MKDLVNTLRMIGAAASFALITTPVAQAADVRIGSEASDARCLQLPRAERGFGSIGLGEWRNWTDGVRFSVNGDALSVVMEERGPTLRQRYVPSSRGTPRVVTGVDLPEARVYRLKQSIKFEHGWDWGGNNAQTGKIGFGLSGGASPSGGNIDASGFSARLIWMGRPDGTAGLGLYSYAADRPGAYGESISIDGFNAPIGTWFDVVMEVQMNSSVGTNDGSLRVWINDDLRLERYDMAWQTAGDTPVVDNLYYSSFYGGNSSRWSPDRVTHAQVADVCWAPVLNGVSGIYPGHAAQPGG